MCSVCGLRGGDPARDSLQVWPEGCARGHTSPFWVQRFVSLRKKESVAHFVGRSGLRLSRENSFWTRFGVLFSAFDQRFARDCCDFDFIKVEAKDCTLLRSESRRETRCGCEYEQMKMTRIHIFLPPCQKAGVERCLVDPLFLLEISRIIRF